MACIYEYVYRYLDINLYMQYRLITFHIPIHIHMNIRVCIDMFKKRKNTVCTFRYLYLSNKNMKSYSDQIISTSIGQSSVIKFNQLVCGRMLQEYPEDIHVLRSTWRLAFGCSCLLLPWTDRFEVTGESIKIFRYYGSGMMKKSLQPISLDFLQS